MVLVCPRFILVRVFTSWFAFLLLFFLMLSSISWHCASIRYSWFFMPFLISWLTALYFSALLLSRVFPSFSALRSICQLILVGPCIFIFFKRSRKDIITKSWSLPMSAPGKLLVLAVFTLVMKRLLTMIYSIWLWYPPFGLCHVHLLDASCLPSVFASTFGEGVVAEL